MKRNIYLLPVVWLLSCISLPSPADRQRKRVNKRIDVLKKELAPLDERWMQDALCHDLELSRKRDQLYEELLSLQKQLIRLDINFA